MLLAWFTLLLQVAALHQTKYLASFPCALSHVKNQGHTDCTAGQRTNF